MVKGPRSLTTHSYSHIISNINHSKQAEKKFKLHMDRQPRERHTDTHRPLSTLPKHFYVIIVVRLGRRPCLKTALRFDVKSFASPYLASQMPPLTLAPHQVVKLFETFCIKPNLQMSEPIMIYIPVKYWSFHTRKLNIGSSVLPPSVPLSEPCFIVVRCSVVEWIPVEILDLLPVFEVYIVFACMPNI